MACGLLVAHGWRHWLALATQRTAALAVVGVPLGMACPAPGARSAALLSGGLLLLQQLRQLAGASSEDADLLLGLVFSGLLGVLLRGLREAPPTEAVLWLIGAVVALELLANLGAQLAGALFLLSYGLAHLRPCACDARPPRLSLPCRVLFQGSPRLFEHVFSTFGSFRWSKKLQKALAAHLPSPTRAMFDARWKPLLAAIPVTAAVAYLFLVRRRSTQQGAL